MFGFNGDVKEWTHFETSVGNPLELTIKKECSLDAKKRIGSQSTMAQVFRVDIKSTPTPEVLRIDGTFSSNVNSDVKGVGVAAKLLPITSEESYSQIENEITIAKLASDLKSGPEGLSPYFPIVYDFVLCQDTKFYNSQGDIPYYEKSRRFQEYQYLLSLSKDKETTTKILQFKKKFVDAEITAKKVFPKENITFSGKVESFILFSELANCDLGYYLENNNLSDEELKYIIIEVMKGIYDLHTKLGVVHSDLHLGNILISLTPKCQDYGVKDIGGGGNPRIMIHDFGKSHFSDFTTEFDRKDDITHFIGLFFDKFEGRNLSQNIKDFLDKILDIVNESKEKFVIKDIISTIVDG